MLIRCKLHRPGGTIIALGKGKESRVYHFKPGEAKLKGLTGADLVAALADPELEHVCDITRKEDVATFLSIPEGYEVHESALGSSDAKAATAGKTSEPKKPAVAGEYASMKKPDLIKLIAARTGKAPHGTTPIVKLIAQLEKLDKGE